MKQAALAILVLLSLTVSVAHAGNPYVTAVAPGDKAATIPVASLDDPANPYWGKYSKLDRWVIDNYSYYVTNENYSTLQLAMPNIEQELKAKGLDVDIVTYQSFVELDATGQKAYLVPILAFTAGSPSLFGAGTLGEAFLSTKSRQVDDSRPYFWSIGIQDPAALMEYREAISAWMAPVYPKIAGWMVDVGHEGDKYSFLPDGGIVIAVPEAKDDLSKRQSQLIRYDAAGNVLKQAAGDYAIWCDAILYDAARGPQSPYFTRKQHPEPSGRNAGTSNNMASTGRYTAFINPERDGFLAVIDYWQGKVLTPADTDLTQLKTDPYPYFEMVDYAEIVRVHKAQQKLAQAGKS
jgi:hypothetical protein